MTSLDSVNKSYVIPLEILIFSTSDAFAANRNVFEAGFFSSELQSAIRKWFARDIANDEYPRVPGTEKINTCLQSLPRADNSLHLITAWLNRGSPFEEFSLKLAVGGWHTVLYRMLVERNMDLMSLSAEKSDVIFSSFKLIAVLPKEKSDALCKQLDRDWEPYPDAEQREANIRSKTGWDRDLYENFILKHDEFTFGSSFQIFLNNHYMSNFAAEFVRLTTEDERRDFYTEVYSINAEKDHTPVNQLEHPLEALVYPAR